MPDCPLELNRVSKEFGRFCAVNELSLRVPAGCVYGFLGPNGAGKTTTIRMILDIIRPSRGTISILGASSALKVRERIGYLPEEKGLYKKMTAWGIIAYFGTLKGMTRAAARQRALDLLAQYGLAEFAGKKTEALSKGMGQKVQVLASIAHDPELIIFDEPFSGLDPVNQAVMEQVIADLKRRGRTVLFSTHVMQHAERLCDRLVIIAHGCKRFDGTLDEARRTQPRRVRLRTPDDVAPLRALTGVLSVVPSADGDYEIALAIEAEVHAVLETCFTHRLRLESFAVQEPSLHDVFVHLVQGNAESGTRIEEATRLESVA